MTGTLIKNDILVTASESGVNCGNASIVFGYKKDGTDSSPNVISEDNIYRCERVIKKKNGVGKAGLQIWKLDKPVTGQSPPPLNEGSVEVGTQLSMFHYPLGLPLKFTSGTVLPFNYGWNGNKSYFQSALVGLFGSGGAPVMSKNGLEGVYVGAHVLKKIEYSCRHGKGRGCVAPFSCYAVANCANNTCKRRVVKTSKLLSWINNAQEPDETSTDG
jgi:hypothetical protein